MKKSRFRKIVAIILCISMIFSMNGWAYADEESIVVSDIAVSADEGNGTETEDEAPADGANGVETKDEAPADEGNGAESEGGTPADVDNGAESEGGTPADVDNGTETEDEAPADGANGVETKDEAPADEGNGAEMEDGMPADENIDGGSAVLAEDEAFTLCPECGMAGIHMVSCPGYTCPECGGAESHAADCPQNTPAEPETSAAEALLGAASVEEMYIGVLALMNTAPDALMALTEEEIAALRARINELDPEGDDADAIDLLDTLAFLPNGAEASFCTCEAAEGEAHRFGCTLYEKPEIPRCDCHWWTKWLADDLQKHDEDCALRLFCAEVVRDMSVEELANELWNELPLLAKNYFWDNLTAEEQAAMAVYGIGEPADTAAAVINAADVYADEDYTQIEKYSREAPLDVETCGETIYVTASAEAQEVYFARADGAEFSTPDADSAQVTPEDKMGLLHTDYYRKATLTLAPGLQAGDTVCFTAEWLDIHWGAWPETVIKTITVKIIAPKTEAPVVPEVQVPECDCGEGAPENIAYHVDSCPRKAYIKTLFDGKAAEEIYALWENYDEAVQTDLLNMLQVWDNAKYEELKKLIAQIDNSSGFDIVYVEYAGTAENGIGAKILAAAGSFPDGTTVSVADADVSDSEVAYVVDDEILGIVAVDISFGGTEPLNDVMVSLDIPAEEVPTAANKVIIVHMGSIGPEIVAAKYLNSADSGETIAFKTNSFSSYAAVFVNGKYNAQKMSSILQDNDTYKISTFNVDLFDYDPVKMNNALNAATTDGNGFHLTGYGIAGMGSNTGINNSASEYAKQGILQNNLSDGFPVINFLNGTDAGAATGKILFADSYSVEGKTIYNDIPFEFVYNKNTGYYEYKSSANHAQLNDAENKIELYADTLSTENNYVATLDLSTANGTSDYSSHNESVSGFDGIVSDTNSNKRLDPYVLFTVDNVAANDVGQIYIKAKVPANVGANQFQLFFTTDKATSWDEAKSFGNTTYSKEIPYTANGDWIEFVIDTSENNNWQDTITAVRVDLFDSNKGDVDTTGSYSVEIDEIRFIKKDYDAYATRGGFYPFSEIQDSYPGNNTGFEYNAWESLFTDDSLTMARASRSIFNPAPVSEALRYEELAYGMVMEFDFYMPVNREEKDLTYYFNGDDDLWVFVDNQLVLDIGGGHGAITGIVDFSQGTTRVENAVTVTGYNSGADGTPAAQEETLEEALLNPGKHTMKIFYLERGGSVSNCFMKFNLPQTPEAAVTVSKDVRMSDGSKTDLADKPFKFQITTEYNGTKIDGEIYPDGKNLTYTLIGDNLVDDQKEPVSFLTRSTDEDGCFCLLDGQYAMFDIQENYKVTIVEIADSDGDENVFDEYGNIYAGKKKFEYDEAQSGVLINNKEPEKKDDYTNLTVEDGSLIYAFTNVYKELNKANLTIIKEVDTKNPEQDFYFQLQDTAANTVWDIIIPASDIIVGKNFITIADLPVGEYKVTEKTDWSWRYKFKEVTAEQDNSAAQEGTSITFDFTYVGETVTFTNVRDTDIWIDGNTRCRNIFNSTDGSGQQTPELPDKAPAPAQLAVLREEDSPTLIAIV